MAGETGLEERALALTALAAVLTKGQTLDAWQSETPRAAPAERAFALRAASAALRRKGDLEHALGRFLASPLPKTSGIAGLVLLLGAAELLLLKTPAHAAINSAVSLAKRDGDARHFAGLVNAVLRKLAAAAPVAADAKANTPAWLFARWTEAYGAERALAIAAAHGDEPAIDVSVKAEAQAWARQLNGTLLPGGSIRLPPQRAAITALPGFAEGAWWVQDWAAAQPARLFGDIGGLSILDLCAAPGGKTAQFAAAGARVTAVDSSPSRLKRLAQNLSRLKLEAEAVEANVLAWEPQARFDGVLLDAPCSATGTIRRHPDLPYLKSAGQIGALAGLQTRLLQRAAGFVKPGGVLVYSVCSLEPEEGTARVAAFLRDNPDFSRLVLAADEIGLADAVSPQGDLSCLPDMSIGPARGMDGFYACRMRRAA